MPWLERMGCSTENTACFTCSPALPARSSAQGQGCLAPPQGFASDFLLLEPSWGFSSRPHWDGNAVPGSLPGKRRSCPTTTVIFKVTHVGLMTSLPTAISFLAALPQYRPRCNPAFILIDPKWRQLSTLVTIAGTRLRSAGRERP